MVNWWSTKFAFLTQHLQDLVFPNLSAKQCLLAQPEKDVLLDFDAVERWTAIKCPLFDQLFRYALAASFSLQVRSKACYIRLLYFTIVFNYQQL